MESTGACRRRAWGGWISAVVGLVALAFALLALVARQPLALAALTEPRTNQLMKLGLKFGGAAGCSAAKCHGDSKVAPANDRLANQYVTWSRKDHHSKAFKSLSNDRGKQIAAAMGIADARADFRCTVCHTVDLDRFPTLKGEKYDKAEGVTCTACHGPDERWEKPHQDKGWTDKIRQQFANDPQKVLAGWGLYDTKSPLMRAEMCTSCHLAIDATMVSQGKHPQPTFELEHFSIIEPRHWREADGYEQVRRWAIGQAVCTRDALRQLGDRAAAGNPQLTSDGYQQAMAHLQCLRQAMAMLAGVPAPALDTRAANLAAAMGAKDNAKLAAEANAAASDAEALFNTVNALKPAGPATVKLIASLAADASLSKNLGPLGMEQQACALNVLYRGHLTASGKDPAAAAPGAPLDKLVEAAKKPEQYPAALEAAKAVLPTQ
jgi:hypothetical protein